jgi:hypothetical protein
MPEAFDFKVHHAARFALGALNRRLLAKETDLKLNAMPLSKKSYWTNCGIEKRPGWCRYSLPDLISSPKLERSSVM